MKNSLNIFHLTRYIPLLLAVVIFSGCVIQEPERPGDGRYAPVLPQESASVPNTTGSLYNPGTHVSLFTDRKAQRVGDVLYVSLRETTSTTKSQKTSIKKESEISLPQPTILGDPLHIKNFDISAQALAQDREFDGDSSSDQSNNLMGTISVTVQKVYPNGSLFVAGEKWLTLSTGEEFIRISGIVRPDDIGPNNTLESTRLADARIAYGGEGAMADAHKMGWLGRIFNSEYWPF